jgi:hypothetical protein
MCVVCTTGGQTHRLGSYPLRTNLYQRSLLPLFTDPSRIHEIYIVELTGFRNVHWSLPLNKYALDLNIVNPIFPNEIVNPN